MRRWYGFLLEAGIDRRLHPELAKRIGITNRLSLAIFCIAAPYVLIFILAGVPRLGLLVVPIALGYLLIPLLNFLRRYRLSRVAMVGLGNAAPFVVALLAGEEAGIHFYFFAMMTMPLVLFEAADRALIVVLSLLPLALITVLDVTRFFGVEPVLLDDGARHWIELTMILSTGASIIAAMTFYYRANWRSERQLEAAAARAVSESNKLKIIFDGVQDLVYLMDKDFRYVAVNDRIKAYGVGPESFVGRTNAEVLPDEIRAIYDPWLKQCMTTGQTVTFEASHLDSNKVPVTVQGTLNPVRDAAGQVAGIVGVSRDITIDRRLTDALKAARDAADAASLAKTYFLANVSHELRTPITAILGFAEILASPSTSEGARADAIATILRNGTHLNVLVSDLLDVTMIESGKIRLRDEECHLRTLLDATLEPLVIEARRKGLDFVFSYQERLPTWIQCDPLRFGQVLTNVVGNAVKFTDSGKVTVAVGLADEGGRLQVVVEDTGCGIDLEHAGPIFEPFSQADASTSRRFGGTGLGLTLSRSLARAMGGDLVLVRSEAGVGSVFAATIAFVPGKTRGASRHLDALVIDEKAGALEGVRVLIVDDTADMREYLYEALKREGAEVEAAAGGVAALSLINDATYDLIFMDIQMPDLDGYTLVRQLRAQGIRTPIVALTGRTLVGEREACYAAGCDDYLPKPITIKALVQVAVKWVRGRHLN